MRALLVVAVLSAAMPSFAELPELNGGLELVREALSKGAVPPVGATAESIWNQPPIPELDSVPSRDYAEEAARLAAGQRDFSGVFAGLCARALRSPRLDRDPRAEATDLFRGLILWTRQAGSPEFQGRADWVLHFVYGGYLAGRYGKTLADAAARAKEERDAFSPGNAFDLGDWAVTLLGIRWAGGASHGGRKWVESWASGPRRLSQIPGLPFERLPPRRLPGPVVELRVRRFVAAAY